MSINRRNCRKRDILKLEGCFFQNEEKYIFFEKSTANIPEMKLSKLEKVCLVIYKRTVSIEILLTREKWKDASQEYKEAYIELFMKQKSYDRQQKWEWSSNEDAPKDSNSICANSDGVTLDEPVEEGDAMLNLLLDDKSKD